MGAEPDALLRPGGGGFRGLMSRTGSFSAGGEGVDSISRNLTNISEKDCRDTEEDLKTTVIIVTESHD